MHPFLLLCVSCQPASTCLRKTSIICGKASFWRLIWLEYLCGCTGQNVHGRVNYYPCFVFAHVLGAETENATAINRLPAHPEYYVWALTPAVCLSHFNAYVCFWFFDSSDTIFVEPLNQKEMNQCVPVLCSLLSGGLEGRIPCKPLQCLRQAAAKAWKKFHHHVSSHMFRVSARRKQKPRFFPSSDPNNGSSLHITVFAMVSSCKDLARLRRRI